MINSKQLRHGLVMAAVAIVGVFCLAGCANEDNISSYVPRNFHYSLNVMNDDYSEQMVIDSVNVDVSSISNLPDWLTIKQVGTDDEGHPIVEIGVKASNRGEARDAQVVLKTKNGDMVNMSFVQSMLFSTLGFQGSNQTFNPATWYKMDTIQVYDKKTDHLVGVNLPWAPMSETALPEEYINVNKMPEKWALCFNTCNNVGVRNTNMFGLFNLETHLMRIYVYFDEAPSNATTSYFVVKVGSNQSAVLLGENLSWSIPIEVAKGNWKLPQDAIINNSPLTLSDLVVPPVCGNANGTINPGWVAFDIPFSSAFNSLEGITDILSNLETKLNISLIACEYSETTGTQDFRNLLMKSDTIEVISPGSPAKCAKGVISAIGNAGMGVTSVLSNVVCSGKINPGVGITNAIAGGIGVVCNLATDIWSAVDAHSDQVEYTMNMSFHFAGETTINTKTIKYVATNFAPLTVKVGQMFKDYLDYIAVQKASTDTIKTVNLGVWNLVQTPTIYVSKDVLFYNESPYGADYSSDGTTVTTLGKDENLRYASFLDPTSLRVFINNDLSFFPHNKVDSVEVVGYDYVSVSIPYVHPDIYYNYFAIKNDLITLTTEDDSWSSIFMGDAKSMRLVECSDKNLLLDPDKGVLSEKKVAYKFGDLDSLYYNFTYKGTSSGFPKELSDYDVIYSPIVGVPRNVNGLYPVRAYLGHMGVVVYVRIKIGDKSYSYARRFLPAVKTFGRSEISEIRDRLINFEHKTAEGLKAQYVLYEQEKNKALRILDLIEKAK